MCGLRATDKPAGEAMTIDAASLPAFVDRINHDLIRVTRVGPGYESRLKELGFQPVPSGERTMWCCPHPGTAELPRLLTSLRDLGIAFSVVHETAEVFARLREQTQVSGPFTTIDWSPDKRWIVNER